VKLDILVASIVIFIHGLPSLGGAGPEKGPDILNFVSVSGSDGVRKLYVSVRSRHVHPNPGPALAAFSAHPNDLFIHGVIDFILRIGYRRLTAIC
jgi:hypothetical protein